MLLRWITRRAPRFAACLAILAGATALHAADFAKSPDQKHVAKIVKIGAGDENGSGSQALVLSDRKSGRDRRLLVSKWSDDSHWNLTTLANPLFSPNGDSLYFSSSDAAPTSGAVHRYDLKNNAVRFVHNGVALRVMRTGPYRGDLLVQVHRYYDRPIGGSYNPVLLVKPDGQEALIVPGSEKDDGEMAIDPWLAQMGWRAW